RLRSVAAGLMVVKPVEWQRRQPGSGGCLAAAGGLRCGGGAWREVT
nr:hypothetical protein [Tanacetum cinerariifolium]